MYSLSIYCRKIIYTQWDPKNIYYYSSRFHPGYGGTMVKYELETLCLEIWK